MWKFVFLSLAGFASRVAHSATADSFCISPTLGIVAGAGSCLDGDIFLRGQYIEVGVHNVGSFGTSQNAPSTFVYAGQQLGFIADYDKNGFYSSSPGYAGDYFVPGAPVEGWLLEWKAAGTTYDYMMEGLMGEYGILPTTFQVTSTENTQSAQWIGRVGGIEISKVVQFKNTDAFFTISVTVKNIGTTTITDFYYMRTVDPDQEQPYYGNFGTKNYVKFQPSALDGSDSGLTRNYVNPSNPNTALVVAVGKKNYDFFCGLGTINPNARVTHYGFFEFSPPFAYGDAGGSRQWTSYGGADMQPNADYSSRMYQADEAIHLVFKYATINPGETVQFSYAYVLKSADLDTAMAGISALSITQPTSDMTGTTVTVSARVNNVTASAMSFYLYGTKVSTTTAAWYPIGTVTAALKTYSVVVDTTAYKDGAVQIQAQATTTVGPFVAYKSCNIKNAGVVMKFIQNDMGGTYPFSMASPTKLNMTVSVSTMPQPNSISFYRETYVSGEVKSVLISSKSTAPWEVSVSVSDLAIGTVIGVKAAVKSGGGAYETTTVFGGVVSFVNTAPSDISLSTNFVDENTVNGVFVASISTTDVDASQSHIYTLIDNAGGRFAIAGSSLIVNGAINYEATTSLKIRIRTDDKQSLKCCFEKDFTITVRDVNEAPTSFAPTTVNVFENTAVGVQVLSLTTTDPDVGQTFSYSLLTSSTMFTLSSAGKITVKGTIDYETTPEVILYIRTTDSGSPNLFYNGFVTITVINVNEAPTGLSISCNPCVIPENTAIGTVVGTLSSTDPDVGDTFTYKSTSASAAAEAFAISSTGVVTVQKIIDYEITGPDVSMYIQTKDQLGLTFTKKFSFVIQNLPEPPSANSIECYCDEGRKIGDIALSNTVTAPAFCQVSASTSDNSELSFSITSDHSSTGNYMGAFDVQACSGVILVNRSIDFEAYSTYNFQVMIESLGGVVYSDVTIHIVNVNEPPAFINSAFNVDENSAIGTIVVSSLSSYVTDPDDVDPTSAAAFCCAKTYRIESGNSAGMFSLADAGTGKITVAGFLNYESVSSYVLVMSVTDAGGLVAGAQVTISVNNLNEYPQLVKSTGTFASIKENSIAGTRTGFGIYATDEDVGQTLTLAITGGNINNAFNLTAIPSAGSGITYYYITVKNPVINFEALTSYTLVVTATDNGTPVYSDSGNFVVAVTNVNEAPTISATTTVSINENSPKGTNVGTPLSSLANDVDAGSVLTFSITSYGSDTGNTFGVNATTGQLYLRLSYLNYENTKSFTYVVRVTDNGGLFASCTVTIQVNDVQEPPVFGTLLAGRVAENAPVNTAIAGNGQTLVYRATDDDGDYLNFTVVSVNGDTGQANKFEVVTVSTTSMYLNTKAVFDFETLKTYSVKISVTDHHSSPVEATITVDITDANDAPTIASTMACFVPENANAGFSICSIVGSDVDVLGTSWGTLTYSLVKPIAGMKVTSASNVGTLSLTSSSYANGWGPDDVITNILVRVKDGGNLTAVTNITLTVMDVNFAPLCPTTPFSFSLSENTGGGVVLGTLTGTDPNTKITDDSTGVGLKCGFTSGNSAGKFVLGSDCVLKTSSSPTNYEAVSSYAMTMQVTEDQSGGLSSSCPITITILDVNEPTTFNDQVFSADENIGSGRLKASGINAGAVVVIDEDPADQHGIFSLTCITCKDNPITINATTGVLSLKPGFSLNFETFPVYVYRSDWSSRSVSKQATITINLVNVFEPPIATSTTIDVFENVVSTTLGYVNVIDPDFENIIDFAGGSVCRDNCGLKYSLISSTSGSLSVDANTGAILISATGVDYENAASHTMNILAKDSSGLSASCVVTIVIKDVDDCSVTSITDRYGAAATTASTGGGLELYITGRNFGPTANRMSTSYISASAVQVSAKIQSGPDSSLSSYVFSLAKCKVLRNGVSDNTLVNCSVPEGIGKNLGVVLTVTVNYGGSVGSKTCVTTFSTATMSYAAPAITNIANGFNMSTQGGNTVTITGTNFGAKGKSYNTVSGKQTNSYVSGDASCSVTTSHTIITCTSADGYGKSVDWRVTVGGQNSPTRSGQSSFHIPIINSVSSVDLDTAGGDDIYISGSNFGRDISVVIVTYGDGSGTEYRASCVYSTTHTDLKCTSVAGIGKDLKFLVKVADQGSLVFHSTVKYKRPDLDFVTGSGTTGAKTDGGDILYLTGTQFGPTSIVTSDIVVTYGKTGTEFIAQECKIVTASTKVQCLTDAGTGVNHVFKIAIAGQWSVLLYTNASYAPPAIASFAGQGASDALTSGNEVVYIYGSDFGASIDKVERVSYSEYNGTIFDVTDNCTMYTPHSVLRCYTAPGAGTRLSWSIIVDSQLSVSPMTSYGAPAITALSGPGVVNACVLGGDMVTITGLNFGPPNAVALYGKAFLEGVSYGKSGVEYRASNCVVVSNTEITCETVAGVGGNLFWLVDVAGQQSDLSTQTTNYAPPVITSISPTTASTDGQSTITIYGTSLAVDTLPRVFFGGKRMSAYSEDHDTLSFFVPAATSVVSLEYGVYVDVGGQISNTVAFSYLPPFIKSINSVDSGNNSVILSVLGDSFSLRPVVTIIPYDSPADPVVPYCYRKKHTEIICDVTVRAGNVTVSTDVAISNNVYFEFGEPTILTSQLVDGKALTSGYTTSNPAQIQITGQNFGGSITEYAIHIENDDGSVGVCSNTEFQYISKTSNPDEWKATENQVRSTNYDPDLDFQKVACNLPEGQGSSNSLKVVKGFANSLGCGCELCTLASCFSYQPPTINKLSPSSGVTNGAFTVLITGSNFGTSRTVKVGGVKWTVNNVTSNHTHIYVTAPEGEGTNKRVVVLVGNQNNTANAPKYFNYLAPTINAYISTLQVGTDGTTSPITVTGANFGTRGPTVTLGSSKIQLTTFTHNTLVFNIPPGQGKDLVLKANVSNQIGYSPDKFSYIPPAIDSAIPLTCDTEGGRASGQTMTLTGSNFGFRDLGWTLKIGGYSVPDSDVLSYNQTHIVFYPPAGQGTNLEVSLTVGEQAHTGGVFVFNYNPPKILGVVLPSNKNTAGGFTMTFNGESFGTSGLSVTIEDPLATSQTLSSTLDMEFEGLSLEEEEERRFLAASSERMGPTACKITQQTHTSASCTVPAGVGKDLLVTFNVGGQITYTNFSYSPPIVDFFYQGNGGDASGGESLKLFGRNFGAFRTPLNITIGGNLCSKAVWLADDPVYDYAPYLKCTTKATRVGTSNVTVNVGYQVSAPNRRYSVACKAGAFGGSGEYCTDCGDSAVTGYVCEYDNMYQPVAATGWYMSYASTPNANCPEYTSSRDYCPIVEPCMPSKSCEGNNTCAPEYTGDRCATCNDGYYRINGRCEVCPTSPWAIVLAAVLVVLAGGYIGYKLQAKNVNLGILSIGIDYFQVLAVFGSADVSWPPSLINMYNSFSIFNFNIDVAAPECYNAINMTYKQKWIGVTLSPVGALVLIAVFYFGYVLYSKLCRPDRVKHTEMLYKCFAMYLMLFYYGYLMLSNNTLAVFNCQPTDPPDGYRYMAEVGADGGKCYKPGTMQQELEPWAIIAFIVYTLGFPAFVAFVLHTNRDKCVYAQVMKAAGRSDNPDFEKAALTRFKTLYNRLFYQFKPEYYYWVFCILVRKFCLSVAAVVFRENTVFLLALYLLILFSSYTAQVNYKPYMSTSEYEDIAEKYSEVLSMHNREDKAIHRSNKIHVNRLGDIGPLFELSAPELSFFNNYNTVESTLLFSAIMVAISAIMFESNELTGTQRDTLSYLVIFIVSISLGYFFWVLFSELWVAFFPTVPLFCIKPKNIEESIDTDIEFADVAYERQAKDDGGERSIQVTKLQAELETAENMIQQMQAEIATLKKQRKTTLGTPGSVMSPMASHQGPKKTKKKRLTNDQMEDDEGGGMEMKFVEMK